jgi:hypothetical protein
MTITKRLACFCPHCGCALARVFWQEDGQGSGEWLGTCLNQKCSHVGSTVVAVSKEKLENRQPVATTLML